MIEAVCIAWLLTVVCEDDGLQWTNVVTDPPVVYHTRLIYGGVTYDLPVGATGHPVGCFDGTIRVTNVIEETGVESEEPLFFRYEGTAGYDTLGMEATGRFMAWETQQLPETGCR